MSSAIEDKLADLKLSNDEMKSLTEAFKKEEFRKLFAEYAKEISDPENKARYENEIKQLENERGMDVKFVKPTPGHVIKTTVNGSTKAFINVCQNENVGKPSSQKKQTENGKQGLSWSVPHLFSPPREDFAKNKEKCMLYDFVVHPDTYRLGESNVHFRKMINDMAVEGVEKMFNVELDHKNIKFLKMKYKGAFSSTVIRNKLPNVEIKERDKDDILNQMPYPYTTESSEEATRKFQEENAKKKKADEQKQMTKVTSKKDDSFQTDKKEDKFTEPKYEIKYQSHVDYGDFIHRQDVAVSTRPKNLLLTIHLPLISSAASVTLDVFKERLLLVSHKPARYKLDLSLPYKVDEDSSSAKFDKSTHKLLLTLPVLCGEVTKVSFASDEELSGEVGKTEEGGERVTDNQDDCVSKKESGCEKSGSLEGKKGENGPIKESTAGDSDAKKKDLEGVKSDKGGVGVSEACMEGSVSEEEEEGGMGASRPDSGIEDNNPLIEDVLGGNSDDDHDDGGGGGHDDDCHEGGGAGDSRVVFTSGHSEASLKDERKEEKQDDKRERGSEDKEERKDEGNDEVKDDEGGRERGEETIVVVHEKECPKLHGILKSRTSSESSSSSSSSSSDESPSFRSKKSVSFSDRVDETVFVVNQSVSTLHATLKNRKKKKEKREALKMKQEARRRKNSGSISSGDEPSNQHHHHHHAPHHHQQQHHKKVSIDESIKKDSDDDDDVDAVSEASSNNDVFSAQGDVEKGEGSGGDADKGEGSGGDAVRGEGSGGEENSKHKKRSKKCRKQKKQNSPPTIDTHSTDVTTPLQQQPPPLAADISLASTDRPDTMLSWQEEARVERAFHCPIELDNDEVFALDRN